MAKKTPIFCFFLALSFLFFPMSIYAQEPISASSWAASALVDAQALSMTEPDYAGHLHQTVNERSMRKILDAVSDKLARLDVPASPFSPLPLVLDYTRRGVINALYQEAAVYDFDGIERGPLAFLTEKQAVVGDQAGNLALDRPCSLQEALVIAGRLVMSLYDTCDAGSRGLLWKAVNGDTTLYLLGTIHLDRGNIYPFHKNLKSAIAAADTVLFEVDFGDADGQRAFSDMQIYKDGTTLKNHIDLGLYHATVFEFQKLGLSEAQVAQYKPWALANTFSSLSGMDESTGDTPLVIDRYVYNKAISEGKKIIQVESYLFQGQLFDSLSPEYQENYLAACLYSYIVNAGEAKPAYSGVDTFDAMLDTWKNRDAANFDLIYDKTASLSSGDELTVKLFEDRDPGMIRAADALLKAGAEHTYVYVVGAGHMVGSTGIVEGLRALGYRVDLVPVSVS